MATQMAPIKNLMNTVRFAKNPQAMLSQLMQRNPQFQQISQLIQKANGDPQKAFYALAEEQGVDPNQILTMINNM